jgi:hypothetical protein
MDRFNDFNSIHAEGTLRALNQHLQESALTTTWFFPLRKSLHRIANVVGATCRGGEGGTSSVHILIVFHRPSSHNRVINTVASRLYAI